MYNEKTISVVVPAYNEEKLISRVIETMPLFVDKIIIVDDCSQDDTNLVVQSYVDAQPERVVLIRHEINQGVGGAMVSGFRKALELGVQIVIKMDGDGQMDTAYISDLITPLFQGNADYAKGNRFRDFAALRQMPAIRRFGNIVLGFLVKVATGYWNIFDPTNGYFAIRENILVQLPLDRIARTYYFETSMLAELYLIDACVVDVPIPARYGNQLSSLSIFRVLFEFPPRLFITYLRRVVLKYFLYDFSMISIYLLSGIPFFCFGLIFGLVKWIKYASLDIPAPTGTVVLPMMCILLGIQFLLSAIQIDLQSVPRIPLSRPL